MQFIAEVKKGQYLAYGIRQGGYHTSPTIDDRVWKYNTIKGLVKGIEEARHEIELPKRITIVGIEDGEIYAVKKIARDN